MPLRTLCDESAQFCRRRCSICAAEVLNFGRCIQYFTNDLNTNKEYYAALYDDVVIPTEIIGLHYKSAIKARNRWMVDNSDLIISYVTRDYGGAADAIKYANNQNKHIINIA